MRAGESSSAELDDAGLVAQARGGDRRAFDALVRRYAPRVFGLVLRWMHDRDDAEEVAQVAFVRAWQGLAKFHGGQEFRSWLFRIAVNAANDELRARRRHQPVRLEDVTEGELEAATGAAAGAAIEARGANAFGPLEDVRVAILGERLEAALSKLSEDHRAVVLLRAREEMSYDEIAATLKIPAGTVMSRLARARAQLRDLLKDPTP